MNNSPFRISIVGATETNNDFLVNVLNKHDFYIDKVLTVEDALQKIMDAETDLIITTNNINGYCVIEIYQQLKDNLLKAGIPFIMVLDKFEKEDILIGLELGIDNFLIFPFEETVVLNVIQNTLRKKKYFNLFDTDVFKEYFNLTAVPMFYEMDGIITQVNKSFCKLTSTCCKDFSGVMLKELFDIEENDANRINYLRFSNGLSNYCNLTNVKCNKKKQFRFELNFVRGKANGKQAVLGELYLSQDVFESDPVVSDAVKIKDKKELEGILHPKVYLTQREREIYILSAKGLALKQIAAELKLSQRTVEKHRANIMEKTNTSNFIETMAVIGHIHTNKD